MLLEIGPHRLQVGDVMDGLDGLMQGERAALTYVDPPWGTGALSMFRTLDRKQTGETPRTVPFEEFLAGLFEQLVRHTDGYLIVEYGERWHSDVLRHADAVGLHQLGSAKAFYRSGSGLRPYDVHLFATGAWDAPAGVLEQIEGSSGMNTLEAALPLAEAGQPLLDPCCGLGNSARLALKAGAHFRGNELNAARLARTETILRREERVHAGR